jgi:ABC-type xylose transport system substrate-binding protein
VDNTVTALDNFDGLMTNATNEVNGVLTPALDGVAATAAALLTAARAYPPRGLKATP